MQILNKKGLALSKSKGFTLIELLVVIAIIGILASIMVVSLTNAQKKARDAKRQAELNQLRTALTLYADDNVAAYPTTDGTSTAATANSVFDTAAVTNPIVPEYMATPLIQVGSATYTYTYDVTVGPPSTYIAYVVLEAPPATPNVWYCIDSTGNAKVLTGAANTPVAQAACP